MDMEGLAAQLRRVVSSPLQLIAPSESASGAFYQVSHLPRDRLLLVTVSDTE